MATEIKKMKEQETYQLIKEKYGHGLHGIDVCLSLFHLHELATLADELAGLRSLIRPSLTVENEEALTPLTKAIQFLTKITGNAPSEQSIQDDLYDTGRPSE